jgi:hypothetical protein
MRIRRALPCEEDDNENRNHYRFVRDPKGAPIFEQAAGANSTPPTYTPKSWL